jgi:kynurenine formamidase
MNMEIVDLTMPIRNGMPAFPGDPVPALSIAQDYENGYRVGALFLCAHTGTHVDAPVHRIQGGKTLTDLDAACYIGWKTLVLDCRGMGRGGLLTGAECARHNEDAAGCDALLVKTGWGRLAGRPAYYDGFPGISGDAADWMTARGIRLLALESPSVHAQAHLEIHEKLLRGGVLIVEGLVHTERLKDVKYIELHAVPLNLEHFDGSPVRAYARILGGRAI